MSSARQAHRRLSFFPSPIGSEGLELDVYPTPASRKPSDEGRSRTDKSAARRHAKLQRLLEENEMKFSHSIQFNAVPDWSNHYIAYSNLKKFIYTLEKRTHQSRPKTPSRDAESSPLIQADEEDPDVAFSKALDSELEKICSFYRLKELETSGDLEELQKDLEEFEDEHGNINIDASWASGQASSKLQRRSSVFPNLDYFRRRTGSLFNQSYKDDDDDSDDDPGESATLNRNRRRSTVSVHDSRDSEDMNTSMEPLSRRRTSAAFDDFTEQAFSALTDTSLTLKRRTISLYVSLCELRSFVQLNKTGFRKVLKKYDKTLDRKLKDKYMEKEVNRAPPFLPETLQRLSKDIERMEVLFSKISTKGDVSQARRDLRLHLREHVVWERNTVWRDMIGIERRAQAANLGLRHLVLGNEANRGNARLQGDDEEHKSKEIATPLGRYHCPRWLFNSSLISLVLIIAVFIALLLTPIMEKPEQQNCLALVVFVSLLWATETIPLFVTSLLVPFLVVILQVVRSDQKPHRRLEPNAAASYVFGTMWTPVIMLLLGGFTIAAALSKYNIAKVMATMVLSKAGTKPRTVLLTNMFVAMFASMWISNVAAPVLCYSIIQPMLRNLPPGSDMSKALILGIALASNIGGAASPIASPQNLIALENMAPEPGWGVWFFVAIPVCLISILLIWVLLLVTFKPGKDTTIVPIRPMKEAFTGVQWFICFVTLVTIALWCVSHRLEPVFGDMGVVAVIPMVLFFGSGILTKEDFNNFLWTIIILAAGGLALGKAVNSSGLLATIAEGITARVEGMSLYGILLVFCGLILVVATFISHTVAALIVLPLVQQVGQEMTEPHPNLLVMGSVLMCSAAMGLPTSGFPNMTAIMMEDPQTGHRYLQVKHFLTRGVPSSILTLGVVVTIGYGLMLAVGL